MAWIPPALEAPVRRLFGLHVAPWYSHLPPALQWHAHALASSPFLGGMLSRARGAAAHLASQAQLCNALAAEHPPWQVALAAGAATLVLRWLLLVWLRLWRHFCQQGPRQLGARLLLSLPVVRGAVARHRSEALRALRSGVACKADAEDCLAALPLRGLSGFDIARRLERRAKRDVQFEEGSSRVSGTLYMAGAEHMRVVADAYAAFAATNPMHADVFPSVRGLEAEVVRMTAGFLGGGPGGVKTVCGAMTSGGTESILSAVKAARDRLLASPGYRIKQALGCAARPRLVVAESAHAAFTKAAEYFGLELKVVPVDRRTWRLDPRVAARAVSSSTAMLVASCPGFPHGVMDPVADLAALALRRGVWLHVDCCLGGFVLPFARRLGRAIPAFDFGLPGVASMSVDTHKFGMAHKGTSVVLYRSPELRAFQYTRITDWPGGLYISPGFAGSRSGALVASAWASLAHLGEDGFLAAAKRLLQARDAFVAGLERIPALEVLGDPEMCVVAFGTAPLEAKRLDIYRVHDRLTAKGWHLSPLQFPPALHMCFTAAHGEEDVQQLLTDLHEVVTAELDNPTRGAGGDAPMYGAAAAMPDRRIVGDLLVGYQHVLLDTVGEA